MITSPVPQGMRLKLLAMLVAACYGTAYGSPSGPQVVAGQATFVQQGNLFSITNTPNTIINWQNFSIKPNEITRFIQQSGDSKVLNRIVGQDPSAILGALQSNGKVYLINPNGVLFGKDARVDVNGLVASSLAISNSDFLAGKNHFSGSGAGKVVNQGSITTPAGGQVYLIGASVENSGVITSPQGEVLLAAGNSVLLVDSANPEVHVVLSAPADQALNLGQVLAAGGKVGIYGALVNQRGRVNANSAVLGEQGKIVLKASGAGSTTLLEAGSQTSATSSAGKGGEIQLLGERVGLSGNAAVDASGASGGGTVLIGGDYQGRGDGSRAAVPHAQQTYIGADASVRADATGRGDGGTIIAWSDGSTRVFGQLSARGGAQGGNGGLVETSGHYLDMRGKVDTRAQAPGGKTGTLLLDPTDIYIADDDDAAYSGGMVRGAPEAVIDTSGKIFEAGDAVHDSLLTTDTLQGLLHSTDVTVRTTSSGSADGSIHLINALEWSEGNSLTLQANKDINLKAGIHAPNAAVHLDASGGRIVQTSSPIDGMTAKSLSAIAAGNITLDNSGNNVTDNITLSATSGNITLSGANLTLGNISAGGTLTVSAASGGLAFSGNVVVSGMTLTAPGEISATGNVTVNGVFDLQHGDWSQNAATLPTFSATDFRLSGGTFLRGHGTGDTGYLLSDVYGLQGVATLEPSLAFTLGGNIPASGTAQWNSGAGFKPIGSSTAPYSGVFDGNDKTISGLSIHRDDSSHVGLFSYLGSGATVRDLAVQGGSVVGAFNVGAVAGSSSGAITNVLSSASVSGYGNTGGLVGNNAGSITTAGAAGAVTGRYVDPNGNSIGGLAGLSTGSITSSFATGAVSASGQGYAGGLVGTNRGSISQSYASGAVSTTGEIVGGLVGDNYSSIERAYASGNVVGGRNVGGLVGRTGYGSPSYASISNVYASGNVSNSESGGPFDHNNAGGLLGEFAGGSVSNAFTTGHVNGSGFGSYVGGLVGYANGHQVTHGYFDATLAGRSTDFAGGIGLSTAQTQLQSSFTGFFGTEPAWRIYEGHTTPLLKVFLKPVTVAVSGDNASVVYGNELPGISGSSATYTGLLNGDSLSGTLGWGSARNVGTYGVGGLYSTRYDISYAGSGPVLTITPRSLTVTGITAQSRAYNGATNVTLSLAEGSLLNGVVQGDSVSLNTASLSGSFADRNVGSGKTVSLSGLALNDSAVAGNYVLTAPTLSASITQLNKATWTGSAGNNLWSDAGNWAGGAVPVLSNVLTAELSAYGGAVIYDGGTTTLSSLSSVHGQGLTISGGALTLGLQAGNSSSLSGGALSLSNGALNLVGSLASGSYAQAGGTLSGSGSLTTNSFNLSGGAITGLAGLTINSQYAHSGGSIAIPGAVAIHHYGSNLVVGPISALESIALNTGEGGAISQSGALNTGTLTVGAQNGVLLNNSANHILHFSGSNSGAGGISLHNTLSGSEQLGVGPLNAGSGSLLIDNVGGIETEGTLSATGGTISLTAHSPISIHGLLQADNISLSASTEITLTGDANLQAGHDIGMSAGTGISLAGTLNSSQGNINLQAQSGGITADSGMHITGSGAVTLSAPNGAISAPLGIFQGGSAPVLNDGAAAAADAAAKAAAEAAAKAAAEAAAKAAAEEAAAKAAADAAAKAAADAAEKAAADAAAKAAADAAAKAAADAAAKAAADAAAKAAADAAAKAAADAAAKAAADAAAKAAADAAAKAAAEAAAKAAADAAAKAAADAAAKAAADAAAKAAADAAAKAAADAAEKAAADAAEKAAADAAAKAAADSAAKAAADAAAKAAAEAAEKAAAEAAAKAAADAAAKAAADAAAKAAADAAAKAAADAAAAKAAADAAATAAQNDANAPVGQAVNSTVNIINNAAGTASKQAGAPADGAAPSGGSAPADSAGGSSAATSQTADSKKDDSKKDEKESGPSTLATGKNDSTKKMYCN